MRTIDCRGQACPGPVIQVKKEMEELNQGDSFIVQVDSEASRDNIRRFAENKGALVQINDGTESVISITITAGLNTRTDTLPSKPVVFIASSLLGQGDDKLGAILMEGFIRSLVEHEPPPDKILFMNSGVVLAVDGSPVLDALGELEDKGCEILVCGTCLEFFDLKDKLSVGVVSNMYEIQRAMFDASMVVRP